MSISADFVDPDTFEATLADLRSDESELRWLVVGHQDGAPDQLALQGSGADISDLQTYLDDKQMQYALARVEETIDMSVTIKFVYIHWMGADVGFAMRGRYGVVEGSIQSLMTPYHLSIKTSSYEETTEEYIANEIGRQSGQISKVREDLDAREIEAANTQQRSGSGPAATKEAPKVSLQGADVDVADNIEDVLQQLRDVESEVNVVALHYPENNVKRGLEIKTAGAGGIAAISELFTEDGVLFALLRVIDIVDEIRTVKYVQVKWVGERVKPMTKAKIATQSGEITRILGSAHVSFMACHRNEVTERAVMDRVMAASGSRKVTA